MNVTREQTDKVLDLMFQAAENVGAPDIGNREDMEKDIADGDLEAGTIVSFFMEFGRLYAITLPWPVAPIVPDGHTLIPNDELAALRDMAWRYTELNK